MPSTNELFYKTVKASQLFFRRSDGSVLSLPTAMFKLDPGITEQTQMAVAPTGVMQPVGKYKIGQTAKVEITFGAGPNQPEIWEMQMGQRFASTSRTTKIMSQLTVPSASPYTVTAATIGKFGYGAVLDTAVASVKDATTGLSTPLTRVNTPYTGFPGVLTNTFKQTANLAFEFTPDLAGKVVTYSVDLALTNVVLTDTLAGVYALSGLLIDTQLQVWNFRAEQADPILDGQKLDFAAKEVSLNFLLYAAAGQCTPYALEYLGQAVAC